VEKKTDRQTMVTTLHMQLLLALVKITYFCKKTSQHNNVNCLKKLTIITLCSETANFSN